MSRAARWTVVLPVQRAGLAKSRLVAPPGVDHADLARAIALDSLHAVRGCMQVVRRVVVTSDEVVAAEAADAGDDVVADLANSLSAAVRTGVAAAGDHQLAVLLADVPALTPDDLSAALDAARGHRSAFVPDADGSGTVLLAALRREDLRPAFGASSAARHAELGAHRLDLDLPRLRRDVDTCDALEAAALLGLGPLTSSALSPPSDSMGR